MEKLRVKEFKGSQLILTDEVYCSVEEVIKLGLFGYLTNLSELHLRQYLILSEKKVLGGLADYKLEKHRLRYKGQAKEVELQIPSGVIDLDLCFENTGIEVLCLRGKNVVSLYNLVESCKLLRKVLIDINFSDEVIDLRWCFRDTSSLQRVTFSKVANKAKIDDMFSESGIKEIRLSDYVLNVEDNAFECFYNCKELVIIDCSGVKFNKGVKQIVGNNPKLKLISFRNCWFGGRVNLSQYYFTHPVTIDLRGARCKGLEGVTSLKVERESNKVVDEFIKQFEFNNVTLILD